MTNFIWVMVSLAIAMPFVFSVSKAKASVEDLYGRRPHGHFHDIPNGIKLLPSWAAVVMVCGILGWKIGIAFTAALFIINLVVQELASLIPVHGYREKYLKTYLVYSAGYFVACIVCYSIAG